MDDFKQKIVLTIVDKFIIGIAILLAGFVISKAIERFKNEQAILKEYEVLRDKTTLQHLQRQIEELYSPLLGLIQYSIYVFSIFDQKQKNLPEEKQFELERYFNEKHFLSINSQIASLIRDKIYLIETEDLPESFQHFLQHEAQFACQYNLWKEMHISSDEIQGKGWPMSFEGDVKSSLDSLRKSYNEYLKRIKTAA
jgi:hypothetical protein